MPRRVEISYKTIVFTVLFLLFLWLVYLIRDIILQFFVALLIMTILNPAVTRLSLYKIPRSVSTIIIYFLVFGLFGLSIFGLFPLVVEQSTRLVQGLPHYLSLLGTPFYLSDEIMSQIASQLSGVPGQLFKFGVSLFSNIISVFAVLIIAFYLILARESLDENLGVFWGQENRKRIGRVIDELEQRLGGWARGQILLMIIIGLATYLGLIILNIPFALPLAILAGFLEIVPYVGPIIASIPAVIVGFAIGPITGSAVIALAFLVQQLENYVLVPKVMEKSVGVNPVITLVALAIGLRLAGVIGVVLAIPVVITIQIISKEYLLKK